MRTSTRFCSLRWTASETPPTTGAEGAMGALSGGASLAGGFSSFFSVGSLAWLPATDSVFLAGLGCGGGAQTEEVSTRGAVVV